MYASAACQASQSGQFRGQGPGQERPRLSPKIVHLIAAARPNFMKVAPLYHALLRQDWCQPRIVHTGQHYDANMSEAFFRDLLLPEPAHHLGVGSGTHAEQTGRTMIAYEQVCQRERPDAIVVVGDVNATAACALVGAKLWIPDRRGDTRRRLALAALHRRSAPDSPAGSGADRDAPGHAGRRASQARPARAVDLRAGARADEIRLRAGRRNLPYLSRGWQNPAIGQRLPHSAAVPATRYQLLTRDRDFDAIARFFPLERITPAPGVRELARLYYTLPRALSRRRASAPRRSSRA